MPLENLNLSKAAVKKWMKNLSKTRKSQAKPKTAKSVAAPSAEAAALVAAVQDARRASLETHAAIERIVAIMSAPKSGIPAPLLAPLPASPRVAGFSYPHSKGLAEGMHVGKALYVRGYIEQASMGEMKGLYDKILPYLSVPRLRNSITRDYDSETIRKSLEQFKTRELAHQQEHLKDTIHEHLDNLIKVTSTTKMAMPLIIEILYDVIPAKY